jgi:hypothetical protein
MEERRLVITSKDELKNKAKTIPEILQKWELGLIPKDSKVVLVENAEAEIKKERDIAWENYCELNETTNKLEGKVEQFREWLGSQRALLFPEFWEKFVDVFGEKKQ